MRYEICDDMIYLNSHNGYVYALVLGVNKDGDILISGQFFFYSFVIILHTCDIICKFNKNNFYYKIF